MTQEDAKKGVFAGIPFRCESVVGWAPRGSGGRRDNRRNLLDALGIF